jgi:transposase
MHLRKAHNKKTGRTYLSIVHGYRENGKSRSKVIQSLGYLDELEKEHSDPIAHFTKVAQEMNEERLTEEKISLDFNLSEKLEIGDVNRKNYGHLIPSYIYHELEIDRFLDNARRNKQFKYNSEAIMRLLVYTRILYSGSKLNSFQLKDTLFDKYDVTDDDIYRCLDHFNDISESLQKQLHEQIIAKYNRKTDLVYYDVTNFYFETDCQDEIRRRGYSKEGKKKPIVQMGLMMDNNGLPISYKMFPGNTHDSQTLLPCLTTLKKQFKIGRIITVADKGLNSGDNIAYPSALGDGYIYSKGIRGASAEFKEWILDESDYRHDPNSTFKIKSKLVPDSPIQITDSVHGKKKKKKTLQVEQKFIVFYSEKYAKRAKHKREEIIAKARMMIKYPSKYNAIMDKGAAGYIQNIKFDKETGEIKANIVGQLLLDEVRIKEEEKYDGYYALVTSELDMPDVDVMDRYKGLWKIEESFKISKSTLKTRPIWHELEHRINAHFLICFISLLIGRIIELRLGGKYTVAQITHTLKKIIVHALTRTTGYSTIVVKLAML